MAAPIPIQFFMAHPPADEPTNVQELLNTVADCLGTEFSPASNLIIGHLDGTLPQGNYGPWSNNGEWWFWSPSAGSYVRSNDGVPVGLVTIWGGEGAPPNWLVCDGSEVNRVQYSGLFKIVGTYWGAGDGATTFNLPPGAVFYMADSDIQLSKYVPRIGQKGLGAQGGAQVVPLLTANNMPQLKVTIKFTANSKGQPGNNALTNLQGSGSGAQPFTFQVMNPLGGQLNQQAQTQFATMPPFAAANFIIKYQ